MSLVICIMIILYFWLCCVCIIESCYILLRSWASLGLWHRCGLWCCVCCMFWKFYNQTRLLVSLARALLFLGVFVLLISFYVSIHMIFLCLLSCLTCAFCLYLMYLSLILYSLSKLVVLSVLVVLSLVVFFWWYVMCLVILLSSPILIFGFVCFWG